ncbi:MAG TPA: DNA polymerase I [Anaerolineaceae bacterium]|nr:DNA polymerase I [Anaerolineaceae bacterium]HPN51841.1 DNA polymerase I [Anaerolineaceae bacterium]
MPPTLYLIDGHALAYRTYFALSTAGSRWQTRSGEPTAGVFGFASVLLRLMINDRPDYLAVAFDTGKTFRDTLFSEYKGTRAKMPDDLRTQMERIRQFVDALNIPRLEMEGYEADDVLGSVASWAAGEGLGVKIITGDRDLLQLVTDRVAVNLAGQKLSEAKDYFPADVETYLGVRPDQVVDYKALVGDTSDNIPGVSGIGEKTAINLLKTYGTLDAIYAHLEEIKGAMRSKLELGRDSAYLSQKLARIIVDLPMRVDLEQARPHRFDPQAVKALFAELEFRTLMEKVDELSALSNPKAARPPAVGAQLNLFGEPTALTAPPPPPSDLKVKVVNTPEALRELTAELAAAGCLAFDTETTSTDPMRADLVGISIACKEGEGYYIPVGHIQGQQLPLAQVIEALRGPLTDPAVEKIGHNIKYDVLVLSRNGIQVRPLSMDTMIAEWLVDPGSRNLGLKNLAWERLGIEMTHIEELIGKGKAQITFDAVPVENAAPYAAADAERTLRLAPLLRAELQKINAQALLDELEMPLVSVLAEMERTGVALDLTFLQQMSAELGERMASLEKQVHEAAGMPFNLNSTQQLSTVLFERLRLAPPDRRKRTASGHFSTSAEVLEELRGQHAVVDLILEYRELAKLRSTYLEALPASVNPATGRVHTSYNQTGTVTGRIASSDPNLQNIPTRTELGRKVRRAFVAAPGNVLLSVDYSQIELRIVAHISGDEAMLAAFRANQDIHAATAAAILGLPLSEVTKDQRRHAKSINFGLIYGMSAFGLTRTTDLTLGEAEDFVAAYFRQFPGVKRYLDGLRRQASEQGYVETLMGRRRYFPALAQLTNQNLRAREEREAINAPIQGTAADIMKKAMILLPGAIQKAGLKAKILLQVHDEMVLEVPADELHATARAVQQTMESAFPLSIPLTTEARWGYNWGEMTPFEARGEA